MHGKKKDETAEVVERLNEDVKELVKKFEEDVGRARSIQQALIPQRFSQVHGLKVMHKYLSGLKSGGDYLDFFEFGDKAHIGILMSDSSGYGLSSAFLSVILRIAMKLTKDEARSPSQTIAKVFEELQLTMKPTEHLSIFYGIFNRKTFALSFTGAGSIRFLVQSGAGGVESSISDFSMHPVPLEKNKSVRLTDNEVTIHPGDRIVVMSDGFYEPFGGDETLKKTLAQSFGEEPLAFINECAYHVKKTFEPGEDMPAQDCSVMVIDVEKRAMRLAQAK
ncbi:MAG: serine/threonine-protein phosphatase [Deltaproteobacteria bacterium]|nr:serine/threonine-protein phosphatase [Deltaproteobacteria bacterium]